MAKIVNQNDIMNVIEASMKNTTTVLKGVKNIISVIKTIQEEKIQLNVVKKFLIDFRKIIPSLVLLQNTLSSNLTPLSSGSQMKLFSTEIITQVGHLSSIIKTIETIDLGLKFRFKIFKLRRNIIKIIDLLTELSKYDDQKLILSKNVLSNVNETLGSLLSSIEILKSIKLSPVFFSSLILLKLSLIYIQNIINEMEKNDKNIDYNSLIKTLSSIQTICNHIQQITLILSKVKSNILVQLQLKWLIKMIGLIPALILKINSIPKIDNNILKELIKLKRVLVLLSDIALIISVLAVVLIPVSLLIWPIVLAIFVIAKGFQLMTMILRGIKLRSLTKQLLNLNLVILSLLILNVTLLLLIISVQEILQPQRMLLLLGYLTFICIFALVIKLMVWIVKSLVSFKGIISLIVFIAIIGILTIITTMLFAISIMAIKVIQNIGGIFLLLLSMIAIIGSIAIIGLMMSLLTPIIPFILLGVLAMVVLIGAFFILAVQLFILQFIHLDKEAILNNVNIIMDTAFAVINSIFNQVIGIGGSNHNTPWYEKVIRFIGGSAVTLITAILAVGFLALTVVAIGLILFMAVELRLLQSIDLNKEAILKNVSIVIDTALSVISSIFDRKDDKGENPSNKNYFLTILEKFCQPFASIFQAIMAIGFLALTVVSITLILFLATELRILQTINLDKATISANVSTVIDTAQFVINKIIAPDNSNPSPAKKGIFDKLLDFVLPDGLKNMIDAMMAIGFLALTKVAIGLVVDIANNLTALTKLPSLSNVIPNVDSAIICAQNIVNRIINNDKIHIDDDQAEMVVNTVENLRVISSLMNQLQIVMKSAQSIPVVDAEIITQSKTSVSAILGLLDETNIKTPIPTVQVRLDQLNYLQKIIKGFSSITPTQVKNSEAILRNYSQFLEKVNSSNLEGLKTTTNMFEKMSEFSKSINGNFDALAQTLNDKIAPLLEELKEIMDGVQEKIEKTGSDISSSVYASSQGSLSRDEMAQQTSREMPNASTEDQAKKTEQRMQEQAQRQNNDIASKLDELIDLFRNGMAFVRTT